VTAVGKAVVFDIDIYNETPVAGEYSIDGTRYNILFEKLSKRSISIMDWFYKKLLVKEAMEYQRSISIMDWFY